MGWDTQTLDAPTVRGFGTHLKQLRRSKGLSRAQVARSAGLTRREVLIYERGKAEIPTTDLRSIAGSCGIDVEELVSGVLDESWERDGEVDSLDLRIDEFLASDEFEVEHLEVQLTLWDDEPQAWFVRLTIVDDFEQLALFSGELAA